MNSIIENTKRQSLTKLAGFGFVKLVVLALIDVSFLLSAVAMAATIDVNSDTEMVNLTGRYTSDTIKINGCTLTLNNTVTEDNNTGNSTFAGKITGSGNIIKTGSGTLTLTHPVINYKGTTTVSEGKLKLDGNNLALSFSSEIINNGVIETNCDQGFKNLSGTGAINVIGNSIDIDLVNSKDTTYSGSITGADAIIVRADVGVGAGTITLSGSIRDVNRIEFSTQGQLKLTGAALDYNGTIRMFGGESIEYEVVSGSKRYNINNGNRIYTEGTPNGSGKVIKSGDGVMQVCCEADGAVTAESVFISSGRMDYQGCFQSPEVDPGSPENPTDIFVVEGGETKGATFSPGIGIGNATFVKSNVTIRDNAIALFEFGAYNEDPAQQNFDTITIATATYRFVTSENSIINLAFTNNDVEQWAQEGSEYRIVIEDEGFLQGVSIAGDYTDLLGNYKGYFRLEGRDPQNHQGGGLYLIGLGAPEPEPVVPEPSTWALLILGVAGLLCLKRFQKK